MKGSFWQESLKRSSTWGQGKTIIVLIKLKNRIRGEYVEKVTEQWKKKQRRERCLMNSKEKRSDRLIGEEDFKSITLDARSLRQHTWMEKKSKRTKSPRLWWVYPPLPFLSLELPPKLLAWHYVHTHKKSIRRDHQSCCLI